MVDLISRQAAINAAIWAADEYAEWVREALEKVPQAERPKGRWLQDEKFGNDVVPGGPMVICSVCNKRFYFGEQKYCPNCGAEMEMGE